MRALLRAVRYAVACAAGVDTYLYGAWLAEDLFGLPQPAAQILAVLASLIVEVVAATAPWRTYVTIRRSTIAGHAALAIATTALPGQADAPERAEPAGAEPAGADAAPPAVPARPPMAGPPRDAPFREAHVLPAPFVTETPAESTHTPPERTHQPELHSMVGTRLAHATADSMPSTVKPDSPPC